MTSSKVSPVPVSKDLSELERAVQKLSPEQANRPEPQKTKYVPPPYVPEKKAEPTEYHLKIPDLVTKIKESYGEAQALLKHWLWKNPAAPKDLFTTKEGGDESGKIGRDLLKAVAERARYSEQNSSKRYNSYQA